MTAILVTRPAPKAEEVAETLRQEGFPALAAPLAAYEDLPFDIPALHGIQALVFTSAHGVEVFTKAARKAIPAFLPVFCVGEATAQAAAREGLGRVFAADGDGLALAKRILLEKDALKIEKILHPCGYDTAHDLAGPLAAGGIALERLTIYRAQLLDALPKDAEHAIETGQVSAVLFFSARAAERFALLADRHGWDGELENAEALCLSPRIADRIDALPWRDVRVARTPRQDALLALLHEKTKEPVPVQPFIDAFGGVQSLAEALGITATVAHSWEKRGVVPANRVDAILEAARARDIRAENLLKKAHMTSEDIKAEQTPQERRKSTDRRQRHVTPGADGQIRADSYAGPDRRTGLDRRAYQARQEERIWAEKMRFLNGTTISVGLFLCVILYAIIFLLAPEISSINQEKERVREMEKRMGLLDHEVKTLKAEGPGHPGAALSRQIAAVEDAVGAAASTATAAVSTVGSAVAAQVQVAQGSDVNDLLVLLSGLQKLDREESGRRALMESARKLSAALDVAGDDPANFNAAVGIARRQDATLQALLGHVDDRHLAAAAFLLSLSELRAGLARGGPYAAPLALAAKFARRDPALAGLLSALAPFAETGVRDADGLALDFRDTAPRIVAAQFGESDGSLKDQALQKLSALITVRRTGDIAGTTPEAVAARAERALQAKDVPAAVRELKTLTGAPAAEAAPFLAAAEAATFAAGAESHLSQAILQALSQAAAGEGFTLDTLAEVLKAGFALQADAAPAQADSGAAVPYLSTGLQPEADGTGPDLVKPFAPAE